MVCFWLRISGVGLGVSGLGFWGSTSEFRVKGGGLNSGARANFDKEVGPVREWVLTSGHRPGTHTYFQCCVRAWAAGLQLQG